MVFISVGWIDPYFCGGDLDFTIFGTHGWKSRHGNSGVQKALCGNSAVLAKDGWCFCDPELHEVTSYDQKPSNR